MRKFKIILLIMISIFPSNLRIRMMILLGFKINHKARLKIFSIILAKDIQIEAYAKIDNFVVITSDRLIMMENSTVQRFTYISGDNLFKLNKRAMVGSRCIISTNSGDVEIGEYSALAPRSSIHTHGTFLPVTLGYPNKNKGVKIGDFCWIMHSTSIGPGVNIESNSIILPGSNIVKNIPSNIVLYDTPFERKTFPIYFFKKKLDETELINLIKEITINYLITLKSNNKIIDYKINDDGIQIKCNKNYRILFSKIGPTILTANKDETQIYFYYNIDIDMMKNKQHICYDFTRIVKSYPKLPEVLNKFDDYAFSNYGLKFLEIDHY